MEEGVIKKDDTKEFSQDLSILGTGDHNKQTTKEHIWNPQKYVCTVIPTLFNQVTVVQKLSNL